MKQLKTILLIFISFTLFSCNNDDSGNNSNNLESKLIGNWELESYRLPNTSFDIQNEDIDYYQFYSDKTFMHKYILNINGQIVNDWEGTYEINTEENIVVLHIDGIQFPEHLNIIHISDTNLDFYRYSVASGKTTYHYIKN